MLNHVTENYLFQNINELRGCGEEAMYALGVDESEVLTSIEIAGIKKLLDHPQYGSYLRSCVYDKESRGTVEGIEPFINFINSKRAFVYIDEEGDTKALVIPSDRIIAPGELNHYNSRLLSVAMNIVTWKELESSRVVDVNAVNEAFERMVKSRHGLFIEIAKRLFSKRFKEKFTFNFTGVSGVALTSNGDVDSIYLPQWYMDKAGLSIGDFGIVTRDPIQNVFIALRIAGSTNNEIRIHHKAMMIVDGDFDGDRIQFIPWSQIKSEMDRVGSTAQEFSDVKKEILNLIPSTFLTVEKFKPVNSQYSL